MHVVRKPRHLTKTHKFEKGSEEYGRHLLSGFRRARRGETEGIRREEVDRRPRPVLAPPEDRSLVDQDVAFLASDDDQKDDRTLHDGGRCKIREVCAPNSQWYGYVS